jgi:hypothetical protein
MIAFRCAEAQGQPAGARPGCPLNSADTPRIRQRQSWMDGIAELT